MEFKILTANQTHFFWLVGPWRNINFKHPVSRSLLNSYRNLLLLDKTWCIQLEMFNVYLLFISLVTLVAQILHKVGVFLVYK